MHCPDFPSNEQARLHALNTTGLLDTPPEERFDRLTRLAKNLFNVPYALVSLVDAERQWFKSNQGIDAPETGRDISFCGHTILKNEIFLVQDASKDERFADNPLVTGYPDIRFYAGAPVYSADGYPLGTLCLIDSMPRDLSEDERQSLIDLSQCVSNEIASDAAKQIYKERELQNLGPFINLELSADTDLKIQYVSDNIKNILGYSSTELTDQKTLFTELILPSDLERNTKELNYFLNSELKTHQQTFRLKTRNGKYRWFCGYIYAERTQNGDALSLRLHLVDQTQLKANERALKEEQRRLADIIEGTRVGIWEWNVQTGETRFNKRWAEIVGYSLSELTPTSIETWSDLAHPDDLEKSNALLQDCFIGKTDYYDVECRMKHKDGHWVWVHDRGKIVSRTEDGKPLWMSGTHSDISEKKKAEEELLQMSGFQKLIFENLPVYLFVKDETFKIVTANQNFLNLYPEKQRDNIIGFTTLESYKEEEREEFLKEDKKAFKEGFSETEEKITFPSGQIRTLWTKKIRFSSPSGENYILGLSSDITDIENQRKESEELRKNLVLSKEAAGLGVLIWNINEDSLSVDDKLVDIYGVEKETLEANGINGWLDCIHPEDRLRVSKDIQKSLNNEKRDDTVFRVITPNGDLIYIKADELIERDHHGTPTRIVSTNLDISSLKRTEHELIEAKQSAESATKAKSEFLANMSHEIRTPLNGILGMLSLSIKEIDEPNQKRRLKLAQDGASSLLTILNDILDFSKIEAGKLYFENINFDFLELIESFAQGYAQAAYEKGLEVIIDTSSVNFKQVKGDPNRLKQILSNLFSNAIKFTESGSIRINAKLDKLLDQRFLLECSVEDTGIGISDVKRATIFDNFTQADTSTTRLYGGSGLGLAIVQHLCEKMGGSIRVDSKLGQGSQFHFNIVLDSPDTAEQERFSPPSTSKNVLVLEPNEQLRSVLKKTLEKWGIKVVAIARINEYKYDEDSELKPFDIVLLDQKLAISFRNDVHSNLDLYQPLIGKSKVHILSNSPVDHTELNLNEFKLGEPLLKPLIQSDLRNVLFENTHHSQPKINSSESSGSQSLDLENIKVLLVEDNAINREVAGDYLSDAKLYFLCAINGEDAIDELLTNDDISIVLMDCQMPLLDGYEATQFIRSGRAGEHYKDIPIIALTANAMQGDKEKCLNAGMNDYLSKPISPTLLIEKIASNLGCIKDSAMNEQSTNHASDIWNKDGLLERVRGKEDRLQRLVNLFVSEAEERLNTLSELESNFDIEQATLFTHSIKGNAATLSCDKLAELAKEAEQACREGNAECAQTRLPEIRKSMIQVKEVFEAYLSENSISD